VSPCGFCVYDACTTTGLGSCKSVSGLNSNVRMRKARFWSDRTHTLQRWQLVSHCVAAVLRGKVAVPRSRVVGLVENGWLWTRVDGHCLNTHFDWIHVQAGRGQGSVGKHMSCARACCPGMRLNHQVLRLGPPGQGPMHGCRYHFQFTVTTRSV